MLGLKVVELSIIIHARVNKWYWNLRVEVYGAYKGWPIMKTMENFHKIGVVSLTQVTFLNSDFERNWI